MCPNLSDRWGVATSPVNLFHVILVFKTWSSNKNISIQQQTGIARSETSVKHYVFSKRFLKRSLTVRMPQVQNQVVDPSWIKETMGFAIGEFFRKNTGNKWGTLEHLELWLLCQKNTIGPLGGEPLFSCGQAYPKQSLIRKGSSANVGIVAQDKCNLPYKLSLITTSWHGELMITHPETNIAPENGWLEYSFPFGMAYFQGLC